MRAVAVHPPDEAAPRVLLFTIQTSHTGSCRLPKLFSEAGFVVGALGLRGGLILTSRHVHRRFTFHARRFEPLIRRGIEKAFAAFRPDIIIPCDERAISIVDHWMRPAGGFLSEELAGCLRRSLGRIDTLSQRVSKFETLALARSVGVACPRDVKPADLAECEAAAAKFGYPVVLKLSHGAGGNGVIMCQDLEGLRRAWREFRSRKSRVKTMRRRLLRRDWFNEESEIFVQEFIPGTPAMTCASALGGRSLSVVSGLVSQTIDSTGPASVVTLVDHPGIVAATRKMIAGMGASGFISFDFMIGHDGQARLIECNPRPTQILHLGPLVGANPARAFATALAGGAEDMICEVSSGEKQVVFFPQEWDRNPASPAIGSTFHDVPWDDPRLLAAMLAKRSITWRRRNAM